jgi:hypothetical protein
MCALKLHLEDAELDAVSRYAESLHVKAEDVAYAALNHVMLRGNEPAIRKEIQETRDWRADNLPLWADSARSVHAYEGMPDDEPEESRFLDTEAKGVTSPETPTTGR